MCAERRAPESRGDRVNLSGCQHQRARPASVSSVNWSGRLGKTPYPSLLPLGVSLPHPPLDGSHCTHTHTSTHMHTRSRGSSALRGRHSGCCTEFWAQPRSTGSGWSHGMDGCESISLSLCVIRLQAGLASPAGWLLSPTYVGCSSGWDNSVPKSSKEPRSENLEAWLQAPGSPDLVWCPWSLSSMHSGTEWP